MTGALLGINKTENERLLTKWLDNQIYVCVKTFTYLNCCNLQNFSIVCSWQYKKFFYFIQFFQKHIKSVSPY